MRLHAEGRRAHGNPAANTTGRRVYGIFRCRELLKRPVLRCAACEVTLWLDNGECRKRICLCRVAVVTGISHISRLKTVDGCPLPWFPNVQKSKTVPAQTQRPYRSPPESSFPGRLMLFSTLCNTLALGPAASADSDATDSDATVTTA